MLDTPCSEVVWRLLATHSIRQFPLHFPPASLCAIRFQLDSNATNTHSNPAAQQQQVNTPPPKYCDKTGLNLGPVYTRPVDRQGKGISKLLQVNWPVWTLTFLNFEARQFAWQSARQGKWIEGSSLSWGSFPSPTVPAGNLHQSRVNSHLPVVRN
jgi:hypothetical protein